MLHNFAFTVLVNELLSVLYYAIQSIREDDPLLKEFIFLLSYRMILPVTLMVVFLTLAFYLGKNSRNLVICLHLTVKALHQIHT